MKKINKDTPLPIEFEEVDIKEGTAKLINLIKCYPYHPLKVEINRVRWMWDRDFPSQVPFYGIIEQCHRKGFVLVADWLVSGGSLRRFYRDDVLRLRNGIYNHFLKLFESLGYKEEKDRIIINNSYKELNCWISEMYKKICHLDHKGGWTQQFLFQKDRRKEYSDTYSKFAKKNQKNWEERTQKYQKEYDELMLGDEANSNKNKSEKLSNKLYKYQLKKSDIRELHRKTLPLEKEFIKVFNAYFDDDQNILTSKEFDDLFNEIFRLLGLNFISCVNGKLKIIGNSVEEIEEKRVYKYLVKYPKALENLDKAYDHKLNAEWNDVTLYCYKALENYYKNLLGNKKNFEKYTLSDLIKEIRKNKQDLLKKSDSGVMGGIDHLLLSGINIVGTIRNSRDSGHGNERDVLEWEAKMGYSYTILLLKTLLEIKK